MGSAATVDFTRLAGWTADSEAVNQELVRVCSLPFFEYERHWLEDEQLNVVGVLSRNRAYGGTDRLRVRLLYPHRFPQSEPKVFDHDRVFQPGSDGHQYEDWSLCLYFPPRREFKTSEENLTSDVLAAAWNWMVKRHIFERGSPGKKWPEDAEPRLVTAFEALVLERAAETGYIFLQVWVELALAHLVPPRLDGPCPCLSRRTVRRCHLELAELLAMAVRLKRGGDLAYDM